MEIQLWGGPRDGEVMALPHEQVRLFFFEVVAQPTLFTGEGDGSLSLETPRISYAAMGRLSRDGRMLYRFEGRCPV